MKRYPFKFLDSYGSEDTSIFFGRDQEIDALYEMVFQSPIILVHGASGTGKTSLIQCGLASKFEPHDWLPVNIRRSKNINQSLEKALEEVNPPHEELAELEWLKEFDEPVLQGVKTRPALITKLQSVYRRSFKPVYLIFDQFEELYLFGSGDEQTTFIKSVKEILSAELPVTMIFSIREEFLGRLYDFEKAVPLLSRKKLRVEPMNLTRISEVIYGVTNQEKRPTNVRLKQGEEAEIPERIYKIINGEEKTPGIQLPYLQVFLDKLYLNITKDETRVAEAEISIAELEKMNNIGDVLRNFLEDQTAYGVQQLSTRYSSLTPDLVWKILSPFVTLEGTKEPMSKATLISRLPGIEPTLINDLVELFVNRRVLRYSESSELYEVSHDALAQRIASKRTDDEIAILEIQRLLKNQVMFKDGVNLLNEKQVNFVTPHLDKLTLSEAEEELVAQSIKEIEKEKKKKQRRFWITVIAIVVVFGITMYALEQRNANKQATKRLHLLLQQEDSVRYKLKNLVFEQKKIIDNNTNRVLQYSKDSAASVKNLLHLQDSIKEQTTKLTTQFKTYQQEVFIGRMKSVIDHIMSSDYNYYRMSENNKLIDSTAGKNERIVYRGMIRDAIKGTENLTYRVRLLFYLHNGTGDTSLLAEIQKEVINKLDYVSNETIYELHDQTEYRSGSNIYGRLRFRIFEELLSAQGKNRIKLNNYDILRLLPTQNSQLGSTYDKSDIVIDPNLLLVPFYVPHFRNVENYFDAINIAIKLTDSIGVRNRYERTDAFSQLRDLNKFLFCVKLCEFLRHNISTSDQSSILYMLPNRNAFYDPVWELYYVYNIPGTVDPSRWQEWLAAHKEIARLHSPYNLETFKSKVRKFWQENKKALPEISD